MPTQLIDSTDPVFDAAHLAYRVRPGSTGGPLIILIHGLGGDENVMWIFERALPDRATIVAPRAPLWIEPDTPYAEEATGGYRWFRPLPLPQPDRSTLLPAIEALKKFIAAAIEKYSADQNQVYLLGFSQGAALCYALSLALPDAKRSALQYRTSRIAGVIALAGFLPEGADLALNETSGLPKRGYLILHGLEDERVPIEFARRAQSELRALGAPVEYHEYPAGHKISPQGLRDIRQWFDRALDSGAG